jgi:hypothetical protein
VNIILAYKNFSKEADISHIGLGVTAQYTAKTLTTNGYFAQAKPFFGADDMTLYLRKMETSNRPVSHVIIMAQWILTKYLAAMVREFPEIQFSVKCHSNAAFLQAEPPAIKLIREAIDLETGTTNFKFASNNARLCEALYHMYGRPILYLPNLYYIHGMEPVLRPAWNGGTLRIGCFGSLRVYKNFSTAIAASIQLTQDLKCHSEIWINSGRTDGGGNTVYKTALAWTNNLPNVTLKELHWASWPEFKRAIGSMNISMQPSFTETFNNVTADALCEGVPSVVGPSIEWVPKSWQAEPDDTPDVAGTARRLLFDPYAAKEGYQALKDYVKRGLYCWREYLKV